MHTFVPSHGLKRSWHSCPRWVNGGNKHTPSIHHPQRWNVTISMVGLKKKKGHIRKNLTKDGEPKRSSWEYRRRMFQFVCVCVCVCKGEVRRGRGGGGVRERESWILCKLWDLCYSNIACMLMHALGSNRCLSVFFSMSDLNNYAVLTWLIYYSSVTLCDPCE